MPMMCPASSELYVVEIEQDQSGPLTRGQLEQQVSNVFADVDLIERIG